MNINELEKIVQIFDSSALSKMELQSGDVTIKLEKGTECAAASAALAVKEPVAAAAVPEASVDEAGEEAKGHWVKSPLVGTFYRSNIKDGEPLVKIGDTVRKGDLLCIIEAMKMMNEIRSDRDGVITAINVENETMVEYDEKIICIGEAQ
ncbi:acetyl-CoA carboxylase biotin carboxyl carrier protein [Eubacterium sp.]|uniref:acetyl-CoA carboxylase biotin carboxyl carrier protein n=1 Tax=Eubacterium sp. TaxID=142586 RepID=UPI0026E0C0BF|nr:acetyl-CoA carboxylase biotin carboxyl carrier protein [Eubacterium sp.]MDO5432138.1 acetyl-CoA carboxylase biotin carboxyl carrier protein [Eubacterium sp.]